MSPLQNLLFHFERKIDENNSGPFSLLEKNMELIYKNDSQLIEKSIQNILLIDDIEDLKTLYTNFFSKSKSKLTIFQNAQKEISEQLVNDIEDNHNIFSSFLHKVSSYWKKKVIQSKGYQQTKHCIQDELSFLHDIEQQFQKQIYRLSYRTLVFDFHMNKQKNHLHGETDEQKLTDYNTVWLQNPKYIAKFFEKYPCLLRILLNEVRKKRKLLLVLLRRYQKDQRDIAHFLFNQTEAKKIKRLDIGMGDSHCDGRTTSILHLEEGKLLYKPRNTTPESLYNALMQKWNTYISSETYQIKTPNGIMREKYSWMEYIEHHACTNKEDVRHFYKRMGVQMAFLHVCNATDFHYENIIAYKGFPVFIDLECLFHIPAAIACESEDVRDVHAKINHTIATSVYTLGVLPVYLGDNQVDISGLGAAGNRKSVGKVPKLQVNTMKIERDYIEYMSSEEHRPGFNENKTSVSEYTEDIVRGFEMAYNYIQHHKKEMLHILNSYKDTLVVRYVPKATRTYAALLDLSMHPRFLHNSIDRELFLAKFCEEKNQQIPQDGLGNSEYIDLMNGDIPYFTNQIATTDIVISNGKQIKKFFPVSPYQFVKQKLENLHDKDLQFQLQIIESSLSLTKAKVQDLLPKTHTIDPADYSYEFEQQDFFIDTAKEIADYLYTLAFTEEQGEERVISWLNMLCSEKSFDLHAMDDYLYTGLSGMSLMYLSIGVVTKERKYVEIAEDIIEDIMNRMDVLAIDDPTLSIGAFSGVSSILYTALIFYQFTQKKKYKECTNKILQIIRNRLHADTNLDVIGGAAGALIILMRYYEMEKEQDVLDTAKLCGEFLLDKAIHITDQELGWKGANKKVLTGFSHGNAGILYALQLLNTHIKSENIHAVIKKGMTFENNHTFQNQWVDLRNPDQQIDPCKWCHGSPGILVSRLGLKKSADEWIARKSKKDIKHAISNTIQFGLGAETHKSICHGVIGNALILMKYGQEMKERIWVNISKNIMYESIQNMKVNQSKQPIVEDIHGLGLLTGLAGVAYGLLYACDQRLPNITTLELGQLTPEGIKLAASNLHH
ncbi:type 2 lanthipeptide synthetase LanM [Bacillus toyonensis]|uniref:type 2 lanthipeptide synthetase LanM n=1 Tax=Bacillus toyonensis TaxID=155322 RepID=UPI000BF0216A|nr:type 2 lanthipeptide synthetase LanM [Bacillus toyonensis]PEJ89034.1 type 2 lantipeptide synthetase LanM [Bacillus toyonensis]PEK85530.1 type 2 lantipeptide synthetase LanM [Bacillus toyonensis]PEL15042.1 type 2 lantipeptide synthetase LanM [Bacillus toyonensis]PEO46397.1 type 2 lantipeptide synthetase LanM [Bacillus toyonensis]PFY35461.1 type 2 lantipeptide synthetase LanM [Bacillus toyonensis]